jgi:predicted nucleic acid-binding protein
VREAISREGDVVVSALTELETTVQLRAGRLGAAFGGRRLRAYLDQLEKFRSVDPFRFLPLPGTVFETALRQQRSAPRPHCRALDRLHLAAMEELGLHRLMTNDVAQATGARGLGFEVLRPGYP